VLRAWTFLRDLKLRGPWRPGAHNVVLLMVQVVVLWTAAQRGMDYFSMPSLNGLREAGNPALLGIEADVPLKVLGLAFLLPAGLGFFGLATGWARLLTLGHLFIGAAYLVLGITFLRDAPIDSLPMTAGGCALLVGAAVLLVGNFRRLPDLIAYVLGLGAMALGGWLASRGLGHGYRTGNGFLGGAALHFILGFGTQTLSRRAERLKREEEEDFQDALAPLHS
jgi:hypothetical protein